MISSSSSSSVATSAIDAAGQLVALGRDSGSVEIFNALTGELLRSVDAPLAHVGDVARVRFFPSGMVLLTCGIDGRAQIIDVADGEVAATLRAHAGAVLGAAMIDRGRSLITAGRDGSVRLWDVPTQTVVHAYDVSASAPLRDCCVDSESQFAWAVSDTGVLHGVDLRADHRSVALSTPLSDGQPLRACARRGAALWCGDESGVVRAVDARQPQRVLHELHRDLFVGQVTSLVVAGDALVVGTSAGLVLEYDAESGVRRRSFTGIDSDAVLLAHTTNALLATSTRAEADVLKFTTI